MVLSIQLCGEELQLLPEKGIYWPAHKLLIVADVHWGKAATFRENYIHLPQGTTSTDLARLSDMLDRTAAQHLLFLGDLFHARQGKAAATLQAIGGWRHIHRKVQMTLVRGNHDLHAGDPPDELNISCTDEPYPVGVFAFSHHPHETGELYNLCGHVHPSVRMSGKGRQSLRLPCFYFGGQGGILPSFGLFTGHVDIPLKTGDRVYVIAGEDVLAV